MIEVIDINENGIVELSDLEIKKLIEITKNGFSLPIHISDNRLSFNEYTVGSIRIIDKIINIIPRNKSFTLSTIFEMIMYNNDIKMSTETYGFDFRNEGSIQILPRLFYSVIKKLLDFGLTGQFTNQDMEGMKIDGSLIIEEFHEQYIPIKGLKFKKTSYSIDIAANQIIKSALLKIIKLDKIFKQRKLFFPILKFFDNIGEYSENAEFFQSEHGNFYSANKYYPEVLELSLIILNDLKFMFDNGSLNWYSFLFNSNELFEKYVRKLLAEVLTYPVIKWKEPRNFALMTFDEVKAHKGFIPDIILNYDEKSNSAMAVIDVKNKEFNPLVGSLINNVSSADVYQLLFYMRQLNTKNGALIYPTGSYYKPIVVDVIDDSNKKIILCGLNMKDNFIHRKDKILKDIEDYLLKYS